MIASMLWKCPACSTRIRYKDYTLVLYPDAPYRCPVCQLELVVDKTTDEVVAAPHTPKATNKPRRKRRDVI